MGDNQKERTDILSKLDPVPDENIQRRNKLKENGKCLKVKFKCSNDETHILKRKSCRTCTKSTIEGKCPLCFAWVYHRDFDYHYNLCKYTHIKGKLG